MTSTTTTLFVLAGGEQTRILASARLRGKELHIESDREDLAPLLRRLLDRDFDEQLGFPARRTRYDRGSHDAMTGAALFLAAAGFQVAIQSASSQSISQAPTRYSFRDSANVQAAITMVAREQELKEAELWDEVVAYRKAEALKYGSQREFARQHGGLRSKTEVATEQRQGSALRDIDLIGIRLSDAGATRMKPASSIKRFVEGAVIAEAGLQKLGVSPLGKMRGWAI